MEESIVIEKLVSFGLTRQEAMIYLELVKNRELTGYEVAKATGISRSNVYNALSGLTDKGAAYVMEGTATKYIAVPVMEFCDNAMRKLQSDAQYLSQHMPKKQITTQGYISIQGFNHIMDKIFTMMESCEKRLYLAASCEFLEQLQPVLEETIRRGIKAVIITDSGYKIKNAVIYQTNMEKGQVRFITDSSFVLTGEVTGKNEDTCLYSGQENLVTVFKEALRDKITLIELGKR